jgi:hypothetical protein
LEYHYGVCNQPRGRFNNKMDARGVGYMDVVEALLPYRNATNIFLQISNLKILLNLSTDITYNENIASFNV